MQFRGKYAFLSNFYEAPITVEGLRFRCVEAAFQAAKDPTRAKEFEGLSGSEAKHLGRRVKLREDWSQVKLGIMEQLLITKFTQHPELAQKLKATLEPIIEDNTWGDTYWGRCNGKGENHLGQLLEHLKVALNLR